MCAIEDCEPWAVMNSQKRTARKPHACAECRRTIQPGETYQEVRGITTYPGAKWEQYRTCRHCLALTSIMNELCGGYPIGQLYHELTEHWHEGYRSVQIGRWIVGMKLKWNEGSDPVPARCREHTMALLAQRVVA